MFPQSAADSDGAYDIITPLDRNSAREDHNPSLIEACIPKN